MPPKAGGLPVRKCLINFASKQFKIKEQARGRESPPRPPRQIFVRQPILNPITKMKNRSKSNNDSASTLERKPSPVRIGTKTSSHRYERRKIREQLRHLDWALAGVD